MRRAFLIIMFLVLGCATTTQKLPWEGKIVSPGTGEFDKRSGVYKNNEMRFSIWFPSGYEIMLEESIIKQLMRTEMPALTLLAINEREAVKFLLAGYKTPIDFGFFVDDWVKRINSRRKEISIMEEISTKEKQIEEIKYLESIYPGSCNDTPTIDGVYHAYWFDLNNYKVFAGFCTEKRFYNQRKIDQINEIINSFRQF